MENGCNSREGDVPLYQSEVTKHVLYIMYNLISLAFNLILYNLQ